jgi:Protein of unknown function (DUF1580)
MLDLFDGALITFGQAAVKFPRRRGNRPLHVATLHRWRTRGLKGVLLPAIRVGGQWMTSEAALSRFVTQLTAASRDRHSKNAATGFRAGDVGDRSLEADGW